MKKLIAFVLSAMMVLPLAACGTTSGSSSSTPSASSSSPAKTESKVESKSDAPKDSGTLGDYSVAIESARLSKDYNGKPVIIVKYKFTNNDEKAKSFMASVIGKAFQDGVELETAVVTDDKSYNANNYMKDIKKGASIEVECCYSLSNTKSKVEVDLSEIITLGDEKVSKTFDITKLK